MTGIKHTFSTTELVRATGVSYRRLDYWARSGLLVPSIDEGSGSGTQRVYSSDDYEMALIIAGLQNAGVELPTIREHGVDGTIALLRLFLVEHGFMEMERSHRGDS